MDKKKEYLRMIEALLFASEVPLPLKEIAERFPKDTDVEAFLDELELDYKDRGVNLVQANGRWYFRTAADLAFLLRKEVERERKLSRAAVETLAIIAYHQPVTRAEIEEIRGVQVSKGTIDVLMEAGWARPKGRRQTPGKPTTYGTSEEFLVHFGLENLQDLPGFDELKAAGLLDSVDKALTRMEKQLREEQEAAEAKAAEEAEAELALEDDEVEDEIEIEGEDDAS